MAVGLGRMLGFSFPENFDHPFCSASITEFWRRWHMTDTRMEFEFRKGCSNLLSNAVLARLLYDNYTALPPIVYDAQDRALAAGIAAASQDTLGEALRKFAARLPAPQRKQLLTHAARRRRRNALQTPP